jgi:predicted nucleic acid-binding protein
MIQVSLDTSFLISFVDNRRVHHSIAVDYFRHCITESIPLWISVVAAGEFEVRQRITDLPLRNFRILPYNLPHAIRAASLFNGLHKPEVQPGPDARKIIINDLKIIAQAEEEGIPIILTEDQHTLSNIATRLNSNGLISTRVLLLSDGFAPGRLLHPDQSELNLGRDPK